MFIWPMNFLSLMSQNVLDGTHPGGRSMLFALSLRRFTKFSMVLGM